MEPMNFTAHLVSENGANTPAANRLRCGASKNVRGTIVLSSRNRDLSPFLCSRAIERNGASSVVFLRRAAECYGREIDRQLRE